LAFSIAGLALVLYLVRARMAHGPDSESDPQMDELLAKLTGMEVEGGGFGGPYIGVVHNETTREIVGRGKKVIPHLLKRLDSSGYDESVYIVFCLWELRAAEAKTKIVQLQRDLKEGKRFSQELHDLTLEMEIEHYLREVDSWE